MKPVFLMVLFVFLDTYYCEEISQELEHKIQEAFCEARCLDKIEASTCDYFTCNNNCSIIASKWDLKDVVKIAKHLLEPPKLLCKEENILSFHWKIPEPLIFLIEIRTNGSQWRYINKTTCDRIAIDQLKPDTKYQMRLWGVSTKEVLYGPTNSIWIQTYPLEHTHHAVESFNLNKLIPVDGTYTATMEWSSNKDPGCFYNMVNIFDGNYDVHDIRNIKELFSVNISNLEFEGEYFIAIESISADMRRIGEKTWRNFTVPSCLETYHNLNVCVPPMPENLQVKEDIRKNTYDVEITWSQPNLTPDYYLVQVLLKNNSPPYQNVSGDATSVKFYNLSLHGDYDIVVAAWSKAGSSEKAEIFREINMTAIISAIHSASWSSSTKISILASLGVVVVLALIIFIVLYRRCKFKKTQREKESKYYRDDYKEKTPPSLNLTTEYYIPELVEDEWHLNSDQVSLGDLLGEGAFGVVHKGFLKQPDGNEIEVAIKMLKGNPSVEEIRQFEHEIEIMKSVGSHPHIVSLLGCCSKMGYMGPFLVVEYCAKGDLQTYLRAVWEQLSGQSPEMRYTNDQSLPSNHFSNKIYELFDDTLLEPRDLLSFARQIAMGMEYLSNLRVVHRDLAARNVLMCENRTVKVADFGLSRDVYQDNIYTKLGGGKLPVKWMALESLSHQQYTTQSDVWSFGIVLWEIVTLGGNPYSTISTRDLLGLLKSGYRMECPKNCSEKLYQIMKICWKEVPKDRPTFVELQKMLEKLLDNENRYISLDVRY